MVAAFGQPVSSTDGANPGDGVNVWATDNGDIMAFFRNNVLTGTFRLRNDANHQSTGNISKSDTPKRPSNVSENPMPLCVQKMGPAMSIKIATEMNPSFSTQGNKIFTVTSTAETKQLKRSLAWIKINNKQSKGWTKS